MPRIDDSDDLAVVDPRGRPLDANNLRLDHNFKLSFPLANRALVDIHDFDSHNLRRLALQPAILASRCCQ